MPLSLNEIRSRAIQFSNDWKDEKRERAEKDTFWNEFFNIFGLNRKRLATFEEPAKRLNGKGVGFIDLFWKGVLIAEHKSAGKDLQSAYEQATDYFHGLKDADLPRYIIVTDFAKLRLYDLEDRNNIEFPLEDLPKQIEQFGFLSGYKKHTFQPEDPANIKAAELMGELHDALAQSGYTGTKLEIFLVRLLFIFFADDTQVWEKGLFQEYIHNRTSEDGTDTGDQISKIFRVLNTPNQDRSQNLDETLQSLSYINGGLFAQSIDAPDFNSKMRDKLLACSKFDWSNISPAVFGSLFQHVMNSEKRRTFGAHYTEEKNILKTIKPLFLDELYIEFEQIKNLKNKTQRLESLHNFQDKLASLNFMDPACGCGNFLVIAYREIRQLELEVLKVINKDNENQMALSVEFFSKVNVDQFYGIEIEEFASKIAETAMWLMDHLMNLELSRTFGQYYARLPLKHSAKIVHANALRIDWNEVIEAKDLNYILGNPPFYGTRNQNDEQKKEVKEIFLKYTKSYKLLDYVACWYLKAAEFTDQNEAIRIAFVSTNSITQGEQVSIIWRVIFDNFKLNIIFAHQTFAWSSEAKGKANVFCVIIGLAKLNLNIKTLFKYSTLKGDPVEFKVSKINSYLFEGETIFIEARSLPGKSTQKMIKGNALIDNGGFILNDDDSKNQFVKDNPNLENYVYKFIGSDELINNYHRWCLYLKSIPPTLIKQSPDLIERLNRIVEFRKKSPKLATQKFANTPTLYMEDRQPENDYLMIPVVSSERREYIPVGYLSKEIIANYSSFIIPNASLYTFAIINSKIHNVWTKFVCGRLEGRIRYSNTIVYNNFPWSGIDGEVPNRPELKNEKLKEKIEQLAQNILDIRLKYPDSSLADLYDPIAMPPDLRKAHQDLDKAVELAYRKEPFKTDTERVEFLFERYRELVK